MAVISLLAKLKLTGAAEAQAGLKGVGNEAKHTADETKKASGGIDHMSGTFKHLDTASHMASSGMMRAVHSAAQVTGVLARMAGTATAAGGIIGGIMGGAAVQVASDYADLQARLEAVTGSAETMHRKLDFAQKVAGPSSYTFKQLGEATSLLETFGINAERALPTMASLGMVFGATQDKMDVLVRGMGGLAQGKFFESDVSASFGLNRKQFENLGIRFDGSGQLLSSATETFQALEQIVNTKYGTIFDKMANLPSTKLASLTDAFERLERIIGNGIMQIAAPGMERLTRLINGLGDSGVVLDTVSRAVDGISRMMGGLGDGDGITRFVAGALSVIGNLPDAVGKVGGYLASVFDVVTSNVKSVFNLMQAESLVLATKIGNSIIGLLETPLRQRFGLSEGILGRLTEPDEGMLSVIRGMNPLKEMPSFPKLNLLDQQDDYFNRLSKAMGAPVDNSVPSARGSWLYNDTTGIAGKMGKEDKQTGLLDMIANNTGKAADFLSLRAQATGTGASNVIGPTAAELRGGGQGGGDGYYGRGPARITIEAGGAARDLERFIKNIAMQVAHGGYGSGYQDRSF